MHDRRKSIVFQGEPGANSHIACLDVYPDLTAVACPTFEDCFASVTSGSADLAMIPIENSVAGRVADIHHLLPTSKLSIVGEYFLPVHHQLVGAPGASLSSLKSVLSHVQALGQCRQTIRRLGLDPIAVADTAGAARQIAEEKDPSRGAIASRLAGEIHELTVLAEDIEDEAHNTTRFIILAPEPAPIERDGSAIITTFVFRVRNVPAALYKALGGFATNTVNMTKLESYQLEGQFFASQFYADIEGHPEDPSVTLALEELDFFSVNVTILGTYRASPFREKIKEPEQNRALHPTPSA